MLTLDSWRRPLLACAAIGLLISSPAQTAPDPIEGVWTGTVTAPQGTRADIGFEFFRTKRGTLTFRLNFPAMFTYNNAMGIPVEADGRGNYAITPAFDIKLRLDGDHLDGTFSLGRLPLELNRGGQFSAKPAPARHPPAPAPLWKFALGAGTWAPPVVADDRIYLGTSAGKFHAVHAADGTAAWSWQGANGIDGRAVIGADTVYFIDTKMNLVALNRTDGALRCWCRCTTKKSPASPRPTTRPSTIAPPPRCFSTAAFTAAPVTAAITRSTPPPARPAGGTTPGHQSIPASACMAPIR